MREIKTNWMDLKYKHEGVGKHISGKKSDYGK